MSALVIQLGPDAQQLIEKLKAFPADMAKAIARGMDRANALVTGAMTRNRFTGKGPFPPDQGKLGVRTNRLRRSLRWSKATIDASGNVTGSIGTNVEYMAAHEFGFSGTVNVASFRRQRSATQFGKAVAVDTKGLRGNAKKAKIREALGMETVRAHRRQMNVPERAPVRKGIADGQSTYAAEIGAALAKAWEKKGAA